MYLEKSGSGRSVSICANNLILPFLTLSQGGLEGRGDKFVCVVLIQHESIYINWSMCLLVEGVVSLTPIGKRLGRFLSPSSSETIRSAALLISPG